MTSGGLSAQAEFNGAFVLMQDFGYLRHDPDAEEEAFWLDVVNKRAVNNYLGMGRHSGAKAGQTRSPMGFRPLPAAPGVNATDLNFRFST